MLSAGGKRLSDRRTHSVRRPHGVDHGPTSPARDGPVRRLLPAAAGAAARACRPPFECGRAVRGWNATHPPHQQPERPLDRERGLTDTGRWRSARPARRLHYRKRPDHGVEVLARITATVLALTIASGVL